MNRTELWQSCWSPIHLEIARYSQHSSNLESKCGCVPSCRSQQDMRGTLHSMSLWRRGANENFASLKWCSWRLDHPKYLFWSQHEKVSALAAAFTSDSPWGVAHCSQNHIWDLTKRTKLESNIIVHLGKLQALFASRKPSIVAAVIWPLRRDTVAPSCSDVCVLGQGELQALQASR